MVARNAWRCGCLHLVMHGLHDSAACPCAAAAPTRPPAPRASALAPAADRRRACDRQIDRAAPHQGDQDDADARRPQAEYSGRPISPPSQPQANDAGGQRAVLRQLVDRQRARPHPRRADQLRRCLDGGIGRCPAHAEQQHAERGRQPVARQTPSSAMPAQENSVQPTTVVPRLIRAAHQRQQHARGDAADAHHAQDHAIHARAKSETLAHQQRQQCPGGGGRASKTRSSGPSRTASPACCARNARRPAWRTAGARAADR